MLVAVAGAGDMGRYVTEELRRVGHTVRILSRTLKPWCTGPGISFHKTDYTVPSLVEGLGDSEAVIVTILDYSMANVDVHLALLEACKQSPKCKGLIPSEYGGNVTDFPLQPTFYAANHVPVREALQAQKEVRWTLFNCGWLSDYFVPASKRYLKDIGSYHPVKLGPKTLIIPGTGNEPVTMTAARDVAAGLAALVSHKEWEETTYVNGDVKTWNEIGDVLESKGLSLKRNYVSKKELEEQVRKNVSEDSVLIAQYSLFSISGAGLLPQQIVERQRETYFQDVRIRTVAELMDDAKTTPDGQAV